jgi:hypothetical protein
MGKANGHISSTSTYCVEPQVEVGGGGRRWVGWASAVGGGIHPDPLIIYLHPFLSAFHHFKLSKHFDEVLMVSNQVECICPFFQALPHDGQGLACIAAILLFSSSFRLALDFSKNNKVFFFTFRRKTIQYYQVVS